MGKEIKKLKLLYNEYEFLKMQEHDIEDIYTDARSLFTQDLNEYMVKNGLENKKEKTKKKEEGGKKKEEKKSNTKENKIEETQKKEPPKKYKKLFRKIVSMSHPDKLKEDISEEQSLEFKQIYDESVDGYQNDNYGLLLLNAIKLGIDIEDDFENEIKNVVSTIEKKKDNIESIKNTFAWIYYNDIEEEEKYDFIENYYKKFKNKI